MAEEQGAPASQDPGQGTAPWSADLAQRFEDPAVRAQVDEYLRSTMQPRMTQLEQKAAAAKDAQDLWDGFANQPYETLVGVIDQLFDPGTAQNVYAALSGEQGPEAQQAAQEVVKEAAQQEGIAPPQPAAPLEDPRLTPERLAMLEEIEGDRNQKLYLQAVDDRIAVVGTDLPPELVKKHVHSFVVGAGGNIDEGIARLRSFVHEFGVPASTEQIEGNAPQVLTDAGAAPNGEPIHTKVGWDDAFKDFEAEVAASNRPVAPPVGYA